MHKNIGMFKKLPLFMSSSRRRGYNLLYLSFCLNMETHPPLIMDNIHSITLQRTHIWATGIFWTVWLCLTYPWYWRHVQLNCQIHHFLHFCQQQPCLRQSCMAASWSHPALRDMNWPSEEGCLLQTSEVPKLKLLKKPWYLQGTKNTVLKENFFKIEEICY